MGDCRLASKPKKRKVIQKLLPQSHFALNGHR